MPALNQTAAAINKKRTRDEFDAGQSNKKAQGNTGERQYKKLKANDEFEK